MVGQLPQPTHIDLNRWASWAAPGHTCWWIVIAHRDDYYERSFQPLVHINPAGHVFAFVRADNERAAKDAARADLNVKHADIAAIPLHPSWSPGGEMPDLRAGDVLQEWQFSDD